MTIQPINTPLAAQPLGHYSQAQTVNGLVYLSGILPVQIDGTVNSELDFTAQSELVLQNATAILKEAESDLDHVVKSTIYIVDIKKWCVFDKVYARHFGDHKPARAVAPVVNLHHNFKIEIEMIAQVKA